MDKAPIAKYPKDNGPNAINNPSVKQPKLNKPALNKPIEITPIDTLPIAIIPFATLQWPCSSLPLRSPGKGFQKFFYFGKNFLF